MFQTRIRHWRTISTSDTNPATPNPAGHWEWDAKTQPGIAQSKAPAAREKLWRTRASGRQTATETEETDSTLLATPAQIHYMKGHDGFNELQKMPCLELCQLNHLLHQSPSHRAWRNVNTKSQTETINTKIFLNLLANRLQTHIFHYSLVRS